MKIMPEVNEMNLQFPDRLSAAVVLILAIIQTSIFITGYRLTADDVYFHNIVMEGWGASWGFIQNAAIGQGRFVHFIDLPFSLLGAYFAENIYFRTAYTLFYFSNFLLAGIYVEKISGIKIKWLVALVMLSLHPLDYYHLAPNAYPFHISLPVFLILVSRIQLFSMKCAGKKSTGSEIAWSSMLFLGIAFSEYGFLFALALIFIEASARFFQTYYKKYPLRRSIPSLLRDSWRDLSLVALFLTIYFGFRLIFPSQYDGNQISSSIDIFRILRTMFGHIYGGTSIASFLRYSGELPAYIRSLNTWEVLGVSAIAAGTYVVSTRAIHRALHGSYKPTFARIILVAAFGMVFAVIVTLPVAMTSKYQGWCIDINACIFLDSRSSHFGTSALICGVILLLAPRAHASKMLSVVISLTAALSHVNNLRIESSMQEYVSGWTRARTISQRVSAEQIADSSIPYARLIEPEKKIGFHPGFDIDGYWRRYMLHQSPPHAHKCQNGLAFVELFPPIFSGELVSAAINGKARYLLGEGWSGGEEWGTWSNAESAQIFIPVNFEINKVQLRLSPLLANELTKQRFIVSADGMNLLNTSLTLAGDQLVDISIPPSISELAMQKGILILNIQLPDARSPFDLGVGDDRRQLAIGLISLRVTEDQSSGTKVVTPQ